MAKKKDFSIFSGSKFIESMRSSGYKDTSYAVGELVDNSIDAGAKHVEILCKDTTQRGRRTLDEIAVLDDGSGMDSGELRSSLLFGDGTRDGQKHIGKFGMGLPNASLSQCKRVDVYSWQGSAKPMYTYIDVDKVRSGDRDVPVPEPKDVPDTWKTTAKHFSKKSGTLVIWSKLDRCSWTSSKKIMQHSEFLIGRIYRRFLANKRLTINMTRFHMDGSGEMTDVKPNEMKPNDPMYLMVPSSTPGDWGKKAMFKKDYIPSKSGNDNDDIKEALERYVINYDGKDYTITAQYSLEKDELRTLEKKDAGRTPHGQHARKNMGVSILRADREITLDRSLVIDSEPRDRWWGAEIHIPPGLDQLVGLTNNKQEVSTLSAILKSIRLYDEDDSDKNQLEDELSSNDIAMKKILNMCMAINARIRSMRRRIRMTREGSRSTTGQTPEERASSVIDKEEEEGERGMTPEAALDKSDEERSEELIDAFKEEGMDPDEATRHARELIEEKLRVEFSTDSLEGSTFFSVQSIAGILRIKLNSKHRIYKNLMELTEPSNNDDKDEKARLGLVRDGLWLLLASWARYEDLLENADKQTLIQEVRYDWGRQLNKFLESNKPID